MKPKLLLLTVSCLFLFSVAGQAQPAQAPSPEIAIAQMNQMMQTPMGQALMKNGMRTGLRSFWDGQGTSMMAVGMMYDPEIRTALNVSDEQYGQVQNLPALLMAGMQDNPEFLRLQREIQAIPNVGGLFSGENVDEEAIAQFIDIQTEITTLTMGIMSDTIDNLLTPEQRQAAQEIQLAAMSEMPFISPSAFEILGLTDAQREQMEAIKRELEPEFEKNLEMMVEGTMILTSKLLAELESQGGLVIDPSNIEGLQEKMQGIQKKLLEDPEFKKISDELHTKGQTFSTLFRTRMFDVLTDTQWARLQSLIDNPPAHAAVMIRKMREQRSATEQADGNFWQPGPGSWRPGDPIPEQYRQERDARRRFPRGEN